MRPRKPETGFTLLEILVVIVIVGTVLSITLLSLGNVRNDRDLRNEGQRFAALLELSLDEAAMQGREYGIEVMTTGYRFVEYEPFSGVWAELPGDDALRLRALPEDLEFELYLEDKQILLDDDPAPFDDPNRSNDFAAAKSYAPHLLVYSSGETTPFELHIRRSFDDQRIILRGDAVGALEIVNEDED